MSTRVLGDYTVIKQIGQGPLGTVFLAEHRFMKRKYVLKVLPEELASDRIFIQRFEEDVKTLSALEHPNIVKIHNVSFANGAYFLVTDCIVDSEGESTNLAQYMAERGERLPEEELMRLLRQIASALDYAHKRQQAGEVVIHRSIKLNNILVGKGKNAIDFYLSDFGLSRVIGTGIVISRTYKVLADSLGIASAVSLPGNAGPDRYPNAPLDISKLSKLNQSFLQGYAFLAPEQKRFEEKQVIDHRADIYALGVLTYYLIAGCFPDGAFEPPSSFAPEYQWRWDAFVYKCLQSNRDKRPFSLEEALNAVIPHQPIHQTHETHNTYEATKSESKDSLPDHLAPLDLEGIKKLEKFSAGDKIQERMRSEISVTQYRPQIKEVKHLEPLQSEMAIIPAGKYMRGSQSGNRDENPRHAVFLNAFALDVHPVTNEQFARFLDCLEGEKDGQNHDIIRIRESRLRRIAGKLAIEPGYAKHPVVGVTWYGARAYAKWAGRRLPTEAEWEAAACGGIDGALYPTGENIEKSQANFFSSDTTLVMSYSPNGYGLFDIAGNVYEWCQDWYDFNYYEHSAQEPDNPQGPIQGVYRVLRGGCWKSVKEDLRCSHRHRNNPGTVDRTYGFRCAIDI